MMRHIPHRGTYAGHHVTVALASRRSNFHDVLEDDGRTRPRSRFLPTAGVGGVRSVGGSTATVFSRKSQILRLRGDAMSITIIRQRLCVTVRALAPLQGALWAVRLGAGTAVRVACRGVCLRRMVKVVSAALSARSEF